MDWYQIGELELNRLYRDLERRNGAVTLRYYAEIECQLRQSGCR